MRDVRCPVLVGRDAEREALERVVAAAAAGRGGMVVVLGEAGIGKSRLAAAAAGAARERGMAVLRGRAAPSPAPAPYRPVTEALLSALRGRRPPDVAELSGFGPALSVLVPSWAPPGGERPAEPTVILLGEAVLALLQSEAVGGRTFVLLEDLHWADAGTLELLDYLADKLEATGVALVATTRTGEGAAAESLARQLRGRGHARLVELGRLAGPDVAAMASATLGGGPVPGEVVEVLERASSGLPFLVEEVVASLLDQGSLATEAGACVVRGPLDPAVPPSLAALVAERMSRLSPGAVPVLQAAAVLGERFDWTLLAPTCGLGEAGVIDALRQAAALQLVEQDPLARAFRFRHFLTRTAVLDAMLLPERARLARAALAAVESDPATPADPERLALAAGLAEGAGELRAADDHRIDSAEAALRTGAVTAAIVAAQAVAARSTDEEQVIRAHELLLDASTTAGDARRVVEIGDRLLSRLDAAGAPAERRARAHLQLAAAAVTATDWRRASEHLERVHDLAPGAGGDLPARRHLLEAKVALGLHDLGQARASAGAARTAVARLDRPDLLCETLEVLGRIDRVVNLDEAERQFTRALVTSEAAGLRLRRARALHELGTLELIRMVAPERLHAAREAALAAGAPGLAAQCAMHLGVAHMVQHRIAEARAVIGECIAEAERYRLGLLVPAAMTVLGALDAIEGRRARAIKVFERARPLMDGEVEATGRGHVLAFGALVEEDRTGALEEFAAADRLCPPGSGVARSPYRGVHAVLLALDPGSPTRLLDELEADRASLHVATRALADLAWAVLAGRAGDRSGAEARHDDAAAVLAGAPWYLNMARRLVAEAALADGWGRPAEWLRQALDFFRTEGTEALARACRSLLRQAGAPVPRDDGDVPAFLGRLGVTRREADVLDLVAEGLSNRDIAGRLYLSTRTVEKHVERLLYKTASANRAQLAAFAARTSPAQTSPARTSSSRTSRQGT